MMNSHHIADIYDVLRKSMSGVISAGCCVCMFVDLRQVYVRKHVCERRKKTDRECESERTRKILLEKLKMSIVIVEH